MRTFLFGSRSFGADALDLLLDRGDDVAGVCSPPWRDPDEPAWSEGQWDRLRSAAATAGIPWHPSRSLLPEQVPEVDLIVSAHSHDFIGRRTRHRARLGAIGYHPSLLPRHRGRDAVRWTIRSGDPVAGGSVYWLSDAVDGGDLAAQEWCWVQPRDDAATLWRRDLRPIGLRLLGAVLHDLDAGRVVREPQRSDVATWEPALDSEPLWRPELPELPAVGDTSAPVIRRLDRSTGTAPSPP